MDEEAIEGTQSVTRRVVLKRGAAVGAAAVWMTPVVQSLAMTGAAASSVSVPPNGEPPEDGKKISNLQIIVLYNGVYYGLKWDETWNAWTSAAPDSNDCIRYYEEASGNTVLASDTLASTFNLNVDVVKISDTEWHLLLEGFPTGVTFVAGYIKAGNAETLGCQPNSTPTSTYVPFISEEA